MGMSPCPVMKNDGDGVGSRGEVALEVRPLRSGRRTSSTRQAGASMPGRARNSPAEAKVFTRRPSERIRLPSASANGLVVIDHKNDRLRVLHEFSTGREKRNVAPKSGFRFRPRRPP